MLISAMVLYDAIIQHWAPPQMAWKPRWSTRMCACSFYPATALSLGITQVCHGNSQLYTSAKKEQVIKLGSLPIWDFLATENQCCQL